MLRERSTSPGPDRAPRGPRRRAHPSLALRVLGTASNGNRPGRPAPEPAPPPPGGALGTLGARLPARVHAAARSGVGDDVPVLVRAGRGLPLPLHRVPDDAAQAAGPEEAAVSG